MLCLLLTAALWTAACPISADAANVEESIVIGIQSTKTLAIRPLEPVERDMLSVYNLMYEGLMVINDDYLPECNLADKYSVTNNGKTWTFTLKEGLLFSNGSKLTAYDVAATGQWILNRANTESNDKGFYMNLSYFVESISATGDYTVVVKAERPYFGLLYAMTFPVLPAGALDQDNPPGTGAYICTYFDPGSTLLLSPNPHWRHNSPQVTDISFELLPNATEVIDAYQLANVDAVFTRAIASSQYKSGTSSLSLDYRTNQLECILMNHSAFPTNLKSVREAIRCLVDVDYIASSIYNGMVERTDTPFINGTWMYNENLEEYFRLDPARAASLLEADGWYDVDDDGILERPNDKGEYVELKIELLVYEEPDGNVRLETANYIQDTLNKNGFNVSVTTVSFHDIVTIDDDGNQTVKSGIQTKLANRNFQMCLAAYAMDVCPDAGFMLMNYNTGNYCSYRSTDMTNLCKELRTKTDQYEFQQVLHDIQLQFAKDCPFICMFYRSGNVLTRRMYTTTRDVREYELLKGIDKFRID